MSVVGQTGDFSDLGEVTNVLLLGSESPATRAPARACTDLLARTPLDRTDVLSVTFTETPDERIEHWTQHSEGDLPWNLGFVSVDDGTRSTAARSGSTGNGSRPGTGEVRIEPVSDPGDLTGIGVAITKLLSDWEGNGNDVAMCVHSLTALLQYAELNPTYKFLHTLSGHLKQYGATGHYHLDPAVHEDRTVNLLMTLMDVVVEITDDGEYVVRSSLNG